MKARLKIRRKPGRKFFTKKDDIVKSTLKDLTRLARFGNKKRFGVYGLNFDYKYLFKIYNLQDGKDPYTGEELFVATRVKRKQDKIARPPNLISIDRIDSTLPYQKGNIQLVTYLTNLTKSNLSNKDLFKRAQLISKRLYVYYGKTARLKKLR